MPNTKPTPLDASVFFDRLRNDTIQTGSEYWLPLAETPGGTRISLPVKVLKRPDKSLKGNPVLVIFNGAVDQEKRGFPYYEGVYALKYLENTAATVLSIADPSLWLSPKLRTAWYAANRYADVPKAIHDFVAAVSNIVEPSRLVFVGGSTGAHAALVQSAGFEGSLCITFNPITQISKYFKETVDRYISICWHEGQDNTGPMPENVIDNCTDLYDKGHKHSVIVLQNATDRHILHQAVPFAARIRDGARFLFLTRLFPGSIGHVFPAEDRGKWIAAAALAPSVRPLDIARTHAEMFEISQSGAAPAIDDDSTARMLGMAARIAATAQRE